MQNFYVCNVGIINNESQALREKVSAVEPYTIASILYVHLPFENGNKEFRYFSFFTFTLLSVQNK